MGNVYPKGVLHHIGFGFGAVNSVIFLFSQELNTMQLTSQNHIIIIEKPRYSYKNKIKIKKTKENNQLQRNSQSFSQKYPISNHKRPK